jgi:hypothetical protein
MTPVGFQATTFAFRNVRVDDSQFIHRHHFFSWHKAL